MITCKSKGDFSKTSRWLKRAESLSKLSILDKYGKRGVEALASNTPVDTGLTASSWYYTINRDANGVTLTWANSHVVDGVPIAVILQYGHGTGTGGWVEGIDYINPALRPIFDEILNDLRKEMKAL